MKKLFGPDIIVATMSRLRVYGSGEEARAWQYHSRSDYHSKVAAVALMIDLLQESQELCDDIEKGLVGFDVNPKMRDTSNREKTLDMRFSRIDDALPKRRARTLERLIEDYEMELTDAQWTAVHALPKVRESLSKQELIVLENKACMTAHSKAAPRLRSELEEAAKAVNSTDPNAVTGGLALVNAADTFVSPVFRDNGYVTDPSERRVSHHSQPEDAARAIQKLQGIPTRKSVADGGYDALGIIVVSAANDGTPWTLIQDPKYGAPGSMDVWHYTKVVQRLAKSYRDRF